MTIIDVTSASESSWIEWTTPPIAATNVSRIDRVVVKFTKILDPDCLLQENFALYDTAGDLIEDAFGLISLTTDFDSFLQTLELRYTQALEPDTQYSFVIDHLFDVSGDSQDRPHVVYFTTNDEDVDYTPTVSVAEVLPSSNMTLLDADIAIVSVDPTIHSIYMDPASGSYNVAEDTDTISVTFSPDDITAADAVVRRRVISNSEVAWSSVGATSSLADGVLTITLPQVSDGVYIEAGYEYEIHIDGLETGAGVPEDEEGTFYMMGTLSPMFTTVQSVLVQNPYVSSYDAAKLIYLSSAYALVLNPAAETAAAKAAADYALYSTLWTLSLSSGSANKIQLGDLLVDVGKDDLLSRWERLMNLAAQRLSPLAPKFAVKGSAVVKPHAARDWDGPAGTTARRIGQ